MTNRPVLNQPCFHITLVAFTLLLVSLMSLASAELFAGITGITIQPDSDKQISLQFVADLPFEYEYHLVDDHRLSITLVNARISQALKNKDNTLKLALDEAPVRVVTLEIDPVTGQETLILEGPMLGKKLLSVQGAKPVVVAKTPQTPATETPADPLTSLAPLGQSAARIVPKTPNTKNESIAESAGLISTEDAFLALLATDEDPEFVPRLAEVPAQQPAQTAPDQTMTATDDGGFKVSFGESSVTREGPSFAPTDPDGAIRVDNRSAFSSKSTAGGPINEPAYTARPSVINFGNRATPQASAYNTPGGPKVIEVPKFGRPSPPAPSAAPGYAGPQFEAHQPGGHGPTRFYQPVPQGYGPPRAAYAPPYYGPPHQAAAPATPVAAQPAAPQAKTIIPTKRRAQKPLPRYYGGAPPISYTLAGSDEVHTLAPGQVNETVQLGTDDAINALSFDPQTAEESAQAHMYQALSHYRRRNYDRALELVEQAVEMDPENPNILAALGEIQLKMNNHRAALKAYEQALKNAEKPDLKQKYLKRYCVALYLRGKRPQAISKINALLRDEADLLANEYLPHFILGTLYQETDQTQKAIPQLQKAAALNPGSADVHFNLGLAFEFSGKFNKAKTHYKKAVDLNPQAEDAVMALRRVQG